MPDIKRDFADIAALPVRIVKKGWFARELNYREAAHHWIDEAVEAHRWSDAEACLLEAMRNVLWSYRTRQDHITQPKL